MEVKAPYRGQKFSNFQELKNYLEEYGRVNFVKFWVRSSHKIESVKSKKPKQVNPALQYMSMKFACIYGGEKIRQRGSGIRKSATYRNLGCPCKINAVIGEDGNHVKIDTLYLEHNHSKSKVLYDLIKTPKKINSPRKKKEKNGSVSCPVFTVDESITIHDTATNTFSHSNYQLKQELNNDVGIILLLNENSVLSEFHNGVEKTEDLTQGSEELEGICRLCLDKTSHSHLTPIFDPCTNIDSTLLSLKIMACASIEVSSGDGLPCYICSMCQHTLDIAYNFRLQCENSDSFLRNEWVKSQGISGGGNIRTYETQVISGEVMQRDMEVKEIVQSHDMLCDVDIEKEEGISLLVTCPVCSSQHSDITDVLNHIQAHSSDEHLICNICSQEVDNMSMLYSHVLEHFDAVPENVQSKQNEEKVQSKQREEKVKNKVNSNDYLCNICGKILRTKERFLSHKNSHEGLKPFVCMECGKCFADRKNMHQHYDVIHLHKAKHECPICLKKFYTRTKMKSHLTVHFDVKPFSCEVCCKSFRLKVNLRKHMKIHTNSRHFGCDKCPAAFIDKNMLVRHSYVHGGVRPHPCPICGHRFSVKFYLKKHLEKGKCKEAFKGTSSSH